MSTKTVTVRAGRGKTVAFPLSTVAGAGATHIRLVGPMPVDERAAGPDDPHTAGDEPVEVPHDYFVRKRVRAGDLEVVVDRRQAPKNMAAPSRSPLTHTAVKE
ncbi:MAG: hypothetical protein M3R63_18600 [Actinomycetota bacterium]|nr:hypothetical protein [Actinomycetota bacterium]